MLVWILQQYRVSLPPESIPVLLLTLLGTPVLAAWLLVPSGRKSSEQTGASPRQRRIQLITLMTTGLSAAHLVLIALGGRGLEPGIPGTSSFLTTTCSGRQNTKGRGC